MTHTVIPALAEDEARGPHTLKSSLGNMQLSKTLRQH